MRSFSPDFQVVDFAFFIQFDIYSKCSKYLKNTNAKNMAPKPPEARDLIALNTNIRPKLPFSPFSFVNRSQPLNLS